MENSDIPKNIHKLLELLLENGFKYPDKISDRFLIYEIIDKRIKIKYVTGCEPRAITVEIIQNRIKNRIKNKAFMISSMDDLYNRLEMFEELYIENIKEVDI